MDQYAKSFTKPSIRIGTITVLLAMLGSFFPNIYLYLAHGVWPDASHMFSAWGSVAMAFGAFYLVEPISYFPVFGPTGTYIGILSGNISQIRLPAASTAQDVLGVEPSSHKGEVVGILAICGSVVTNILFLTVAVVAGSTLLAFLPESVTSAMANYKTVSIAGIVLMVFTLLRGFIGGSSYTALVITTTGIAITQPFIINAFGMISALWFPPAERGIANGWGMISTYLGVVMAQFGVPWLMSTFGLDIPGALKVFGFLSIPMILWFILFAREKPPTPPADEDLIERVSFADGMKQLAKNKKFIYALLVFWLLQGVYFTLTTLMEPILQFFNGGSMDSLFIGTLGTILTVTGVITTLVLPIASDRSKSKKRKPIVLVCEIGTLVGLVLIITGHTVGLQILMACCLGIFLTGVTPIVMVLGYESAYPVSEGTTESLMQLGANGWGLICLLAVNGIFQGNHMGTLVFFLAGTVLSLVLTMMIKEASLKERRIE